MKMTSITIRSMNGKSRTMLSGIEMRELPFNRMRRLKKPNFGDIRSACLCRPPSVGTAFVEGRRFFTPCKKSMAGDLGGGGTAEEVLRRGKEDSSAVVWTRKLVVLAEV